MRLPFILAVLLIAAPALADITGPARIIDGDTIDIAGAPMVDNRKGMT